MPFSPDQNLQQENENTVVSREQEYSRLIPFDGTA